MQGAYRALEVYRNPVARIVNADKYLLCNHSRLVTISPLVFCIVDGEQSCNSVVGTENREFVTQF